MVWDPETETLACSMILLELDEHPQVYPTRQTHMDIGVMH